MTTSASATRYPVAFAALIVGLLLAGAMALSLIVTGDPAYPVKVFGNARTSGTLSAVAAIRPEEHPALPRGRVDEGQLLPLPPPPTWTISAGALASADPVYRVMAVVSMARELDAARVAAQHGRRAEAQRLYDAMGRRFPGVRALLLERVNVLGSFGEHAQAADLIRSQLQRFPNDVELRILGAHNAWWSHQALLADSLVTLALELDAKNADASRLRSSIRASTSPPLSVSLRWARDGGGGPLEQLILARAYVREQQYGASVNAYRLALASPAQRTDSLLLEAASAAAATDSLGALELFTVQYLAMRPDDEDAVLRLARAYSWRGEYTTALRHYARLARQDSIRFEVAQVLVWSGKEREAERELRVVVERDPRNAAALKLLGDLAAWHAKWIDAERYYARAQRLAPGFPGLADAVVALQLARERERLALIRSRAVPEAYGVAFNGYGDNQRFRWASTRASRVFAARDATFRAIAQHNVIEGAPRGLRSLNQGLSGRLESEFDLWRRARLGLMGGAESYAALSTFPVYGVGVTIYDVLGTELAAAWSHEPAAVLVGSPVALQAHTLADAFTLTASKTSGAWSLWARAEADRLTSLIGDARRTAAAASLSHTLTPRVSASLAVSALAFDRAAPTLPGWGNLFWAPERFAEPLASVSYRAPLSQGLLLTSSLSLGYGFARERGNDRRFGSGAMPTGGASTDLVYAWGPWNVGAGASVNGALRRGYRAGAFRARGSYSFGR